MLCYKRIDLKEREKIYILLRQEVNQAYIARRLGRHRSSIGHELKGRHFTYEVIIWAVRWYCKYGISYRDLEEMLLERVLLLHWGYLR